MRQPAGLVWTELQQRRYEQLIKGATAAELAPLISLIEGLEREFPNDVAFERELWGDALERALADHVPRGGPAATTASDAAGAAGAAASDGPVHRPVSLGSVPSAHADGETEHG
jgi:hypothetical protein